MIFYSDQNRSNNNFKYNRNYNDNNKEGKCSKVTQCFSDTKSKILSFMKAHPFIFFGIIAGIIIVIIIIIVVAVVVSKSSKDKEKEYVFSLSEKSLKEVNNIYNNIGNNDKGTLVKFCEYLESKASNLNEAQKVYLAYSWITNNIKYDHEGLAANKVIYDPDKFFSIRKTVCSGYSWLFRRLLVAMKYDETKIKNIQGYSKGAGYSVYNNPVSNHEWNAVNIDGHWCSVDTTWDVNNTKFYYLCTRPQCFVRDHLPDNEENQFLSNPISLTTFHNYAWTTGRFCDFKGEINEDKSIYNVCGRGKFTVKYNVDYETKLHINRVDGVSFKITPISSGYQIDFYVNKAGKFELIMFLANEDLHYEHIGYVNIKCDKAPSEKYYFDQ